MRVDRRVRCGLPPAHEAQTLDDLSAAAAVAPPHDAGVPNVRTDPVGVLEAQAQTASDLGALHW